MIFILLCTFLQVQAWVEYECPQQNLFPVVVNGKNKKCNSAGGGCDNNALCIGALNQRNIYICCSVSKTGGSKLCPNDAVPQPSAMGFVACTSNPKVCLPGFTCQKVIGGVSRICCEEKTPNVLCPNSLQLYKDQNGSPRFCHPSQPATCPGTYSCLAALSPSGSFVCCASTNAMSCPSNFKPELTNTGDYIFCDRTQSTGCPTGSVCLVDPSSQQSLCCRASASLTVCPNDLKPLLNGKGGVTVCSGPNAVCTGLGYLCVFSSTFGKHVCCGKQTNAVCADGRTTLSLYDPDTTTYACNPLTPVTGCPFGFDCAPSTEIGVSVCCLSDSGNDIFWKKTIKLADSSKEECPKGMTSYLRRNEPKKCDTKKKGKDCPRGYSCQTGSSSSKDSYCCKINEEAQTTKSTV